MNVICTPIPPRRPGPRFPIAFAAAFAVALWFLIRIAVRSCT